MKYNKKDPAFADYSTNTRVFYFFVFPVFSFYFTLNDFALFE